MFGDYELGEFELEHSGVKIEVRRAGVGYRYRRGNFSRLLLASSGTMIINPVEPVNLPKSVTNYLMIELSEEVVVPPKGIGLVYLTFPVEIGVILSDGGAYEVVDVFSFVKPKYALYGEPSRGIICRYWRSDVYSEQPERDRLREGVLELRVVNGSDEWQKVRKVVMNVYDMKIYYNDDIVMSFGYVRIVSSTVAETGFTEGKFEGKKSVELYTARKLPIVKKKFFMEWGI
ncbi:MAG: DUF432 domain-containing protein [Archaeoglobaceae archaeon]